MVRNSGLVLNQLRVGCQKLVSLLLDDARPDFSVEDEGTPAGGEHLGKARLKRPDQTQVT